MVSRGDGEGDEDDEWEEEDADDVTDDNCFSFKGTPKQEVVAATRTSDDVPCDVALHGTGAEGEGVATTLSGTSAEGEQAAAMAE